MKSVYLISANASQLQGTMSESKCQDFPTFADSMITFCKFTTQRVDKGSCRRDVGWRISQDFARKIIIHDNVDATMQKKPVHKGAYYFEDNTIENT